jgi:hypothetical protein
MTDSTDETDDDTREKDGIRGGAETVEVVRDALDQEDDEEGDVDDTRGVQ